MIQILSDKNVRNENIISKEELEKLLNEDKTKIYEVIRVINNKPVFLKEHYERMNESLKLSNINYKIDFNNYNNTIEKLIKENNFENCNVRVSFIDDDEPILLMYFVKSSYPSKELFENGIYTVTVKKSRKNPNVKHYVDDFKDSIDKLLKETNAFEAILVNDDETISEGSKSNVFFVQDKSIITSHDSSVLLGVTRSKVIEVCENNGIKVIKRNIYFKELKDFEGAFITGTSNDVLPIKTIDKIIYDSAQNEIVKRAYELYLGEMKKEVN